MSDLELSPNPPTDPGEASAGAMPLWQHLDELRGILVKSFLALGMVFCVTYYFNESIIRFLEAPILSALPEGQKQLYFSGLADKFLVYLKVSFYASLVLTSPYLLKQVWNFIVPGLKENERQYAVPVLFMGSLAFLLGLAFAYFVVIPTGYRFLLNFGGPNEKPLINVSDYFGLTIQLLLSMGVLFELPVIAFFLGKMGVIEVEWLKRFRPQAYLGLTVLAAFLTPTPDAFTLFLVLIPLILLYELSVQLIGWAHKV
ncbi:MAG: twin-arginine translocase subunit TatC [Proteobacteria bacterium]|nr:twin-arginine translocase subunit TatC [Pseudomonadota bacterium]NBY20394.1 twin-arginine translocase subunit TatC [bacterium]